MREAKSNNVSRSNHKVQRRQSYLSENGSNTTLTPTSTPTPAPIALASSGVIGHNQRGTFREDQGSGCNDEPLDSIASQYLGTIYAETWEVIFGHFLSRFSCPFTFGDENVSERMVSIRTLCTQLDRWMADSTSATSPRTYTEQFDLNIGDDTDRRTEESLNVVVRAYAARWLPLLAPSADPQELQQVILRLWREARRDMLRVINRPSYRSMLTLYLFGLTPIPEGISEEEEHDGLSGHVCVQAALQQVYMLRVRQKSLQFNGSKMSPTVPLKNIALGPDPMATSSFLTAESIAHWAALTFDTSASMTLSARPILSSGLFGYEDDWCWCLVRSCTEMFQATRKEWYAAGMEITESKANQLVASGSAFKLLMWKLAAVFREALRDGHDEQVLKKVYDSIIGGIDQFNRTYRDLLEACQKRINFLSQDTKFRWYVLMLHYNLSILLVVDAIEGTQRHDLLPPLSGAKADAENSMINTLAFGLETSYSINLESTGASPRTDRITVPLLAVEPYPHHVVAAVQLMFRAIQRDRKVEEIDAHTHANLASILHRVLRLLPDSSKSIQAARKLADSRAEVT